MKNRFYLHIKFPQKFFMLLFSLMIFADFVHAELTASIKPIGSPYTGVSIHVLDDQLTTMPKNDLGKYFNALQIATRKNADGSTGKEFFTIPQQLIGGMAGGCSLKPNVQLDCTIFAFTDPTLPHTTITYNAQSRTFELKATDADADKMSALFPKDSNQSFHLSFLDGTLRFTGSPGKFDFKFAPLLPNPNGPGKTKKSIRNQSTKLK